MPKKVAVYTMTRGRLEDTRATFESMRETRPGYPYDHYVFDQGSVDGTRLWLKSQVDEGRLAGVVEFGENVGLHIGMNRAHDHLLRRDYDFIMKVDNDIEFKTKRWLKKLIRAHRQLHPTAVIGPRVENLQYPPKVITRRRAGDFSYTFLEIIGGAARLMPADILKEFSFNERMPLAWGGDATFANYCGERGYPMVYVEDVRVRHMNTDEQQVEVRPDYMKRRTYEAYYPYGV